MLGVLDCTRQTGKVRGEYNFAYLTRQDCRRLKKRKQKKRRTGLAQQRLGQPTSILPPPRVEPWEALLLCLVTNPLIEHDELMDTQPSGSVWKWIASSAQAE
eukprot:1699146-Amphidinium_carterae.1